MELTEWLKAERGRPLALAKHMKKSKATVSLWQTYGVPMKLMREVSAFTGDAVSVSDLLAHALRCSEQRCDISKQAA